LVNECFGQKGHEIFLEDNTDEELSGGEAGTGEPKVDEWERGEESASSNEDALLDLTDEGDSEDVFDDDISYAV
jgi:hypothetical protein